MSNTTQMDFIGSSLSEPTYKQLSFIEEGNKLTCGREPSFHAVEKFFNGLNRDAIDSHQEYWSKLEPTSLKEKFRRWVFAFCSVHTSWQSNVKGYNALKDYEKWLNNDKELMRRLKKSGVGLYNNRTRFLSKFSKQFFDNPESFDKKEDENYVSYRNRLVDDILGLQKAKTSFALEVTV